MKKIFLQVLTIKYMIFYKSFLRVVRNLKKIIKKNRKKMNRVVRLTELQRLIDVNTAQGAILSIQPLEVNYLLENQIVNKRVCEIYTHFNKSSLPLMDHLRIKNATEDCMVKLSVEDFDRINSIY